MVTPDLEAHPVLRTLRHRQLGRQVDQPDCPGLELRHSDVEDFPSVRESHGQGLPD